LELEEEVLIEGAPEIADGCGVRGDAVGSSVLVLTEGALDIVGRVGVLETFIFITVGDAEGSGCASVTAPAEGDTVGEAVSLLAVKLKQALVASFCQ